jgi:hypothetical protein
VRSRFVAEHASEGRPASIEHGLRQAGLGESGGVHIADCDVVELSDDAGREFVVKVTPRMGDTSVDVRRLTSFAGPLRGSELVGQLPQMPRVLDLRLIRQGSEVFKAQVDADAAARRPRLGRSDLDDDIQEPMPTCIAGEVCAVLDLAFGQRPRIEHSEGVSGEAEGISRTLEIPAFQGHPAQRAPATPAQERPVPLTAGLGVLLAHCVDRACVRGQFLAASRRQSIKIKPRSAT